MSIVNIDQEKIDCENNIKLLYKEIFATENGKLVLSDIINQGKVMAITLYNGNVNDLLFYEGQRSMATYVLNMVTGE
jgi:hypothetical protein